MAHPGKAGQGFLGRPATAIRAELEATVGVVSRKTENVRS